MGLGKGKGSSHVCANLNSNEQHVKPSTRSSLAQAHVPGRDQHCAARTWLSSSQTSTRARSRVFRRQADPESEVDKQHCSLAGGRGSALYFTLLVTLLKTCTCVLIHEHTSRALDHASETSRRCPKPGSLENHFLWDSNYHVNLPGHLPLVPTVSFWTHFLTPPPLLSFCDYCFVSSCHDWKALWGQGTRED